MRGPAPPTGTVDAPPSGVGSRSSARSQTGRTERPERAHQNGHYHQRRGVRSHVRLDHGQHGGPRRRQSTGFRDDTVRAPPLGVGLLRRLRRELWGQVLEHANRRHRRRPHFVEEVPLPLSACPGRQEELHRGARRRLIIIIIIIE